MTRRGFTLIELLVVLAILSAVTTLALRSASQLQERTSFESTQRALEVTAAALVGDGDPDEPGFLGDMGRMPIPPPGAAGGTVEFVPDELWDKLDGDLESAAGSAELHGDAEVVALTGWRGPYLQLPPLADEDLEKNEPRHLDGYGNQIMLRLQGTADDPVKWEIMSYGPNRSDPNDDVRLTLYDDASEQTINRLFTDLVVMVNLTAGLKINHTVTVVAYGPGPGGALAPIDDVESEFVNGTTYRVDFTDDDRLTRGPWVVRAYVHPLGQDPQTSAVAKSDVVRLSLAPRAHVIDLTVDVPGADDGGGPQSPPKSGPGSKNSVPARKGP